ncbi:MAG: uracil-DNA glycosylase [Actinobacteria bacterium]|nr:uracil-DNA glycosylase [Actinomycetota bacterium]
MPVPADLAALDAAIVGCRRCPRLVAWREDVAVVKRASYADEEYWGRPVPGFGSLSPTIWIVGLAPAAHGANRTGRMFTGDRSGDWLFGSLHRVGLAEIGTSTARGDGQRMDRVRITAAVHCAPPDNKPTTEEKAACADWLDAEIGIIEPTVLVIVALGGIAWLATLKALRTAGWQVDRASFGHAASTLATSPAGREVLVLASYHPSQQNTFTGRLTEPMRDDVPTRARDTAN